jgi:hypothetical protein
MQLFDENDLAQPSRLTGSHARLLIALAELDCSKHVLAALLSLDGLHQDHIRFLTGPVVQHRSPWAETTPEWLCRAVTVDRLRIILDEHERGEAGWQVGPAELTAVMYPATMDAPLSMEYTDIYLWAAAQANARHYGKTVAEMWSAVGGDPVEDRHITDPSGRYHHTYRQLCSDIRRRVVKAASAASRPGKSPAQESAVITEQLSLF